MPQAKSQYVLNSAHRSDAIVNLPPNTFLLNPDNAHRMIGQSQLWLVFKKELFVFLLFVLLCVFFLLICLQGLNPLLLASQIQQTGVSVDGTVIGQRTAPAAGRGQVTNYLKYHFTVLSGEIIAVEQVVSRQTVERFHVGDVVPVKYLAENPGFSALTGRAKDDLLDFGNFLIALTGGIGFLISLGAMLFVGWYMWREDRFFAQGRLLIGHILACHGRVEIMPKSPDVQRTIPSLRGRYMVDLSYTFHSPAGKTIKSVAKRQRQDLYGCGLPKFGYPIAVLYLDDKCYKIL